MSTEGNVIHYDFIEKFIMYLSEKYHILEIAVDRWNATQMIQNLEGEGFTIVPFGQGFSSMSAPTKEFYRLLMEGRIIHGGNPVLRWMAGNVVIDTDPAGNIKVTKAKSKEKIDGIVAAIMALDRCIRQEGQSGAFTMREDCWYFKEGVWDFSVIYFGEGMLLLTAQLEAGMDSLWGVRLPGRG